MVAEIKRSSGMASGRPRISWGNVHARIGLEILERFLERHPENPLAWHHLASWHLHMNEPGKAEDVLRLGLMRHERSDLGPELGISLLRQKKLEALRKFAEGWLGTSPEAALPRVFLAYVALLSGRRSDARRLAQEANVRLDGVDRTYPVYQLGLVYLGLPDEEEKARELLTRAASGPPHDRYAWAACQFLAAMPGTHDEEIAAWITRARNLMPDFSGDYAEEVTRLRRWIVEQREDDASTS